MSMPFWNAGGSQRANMAEPVILCFQAATLPSTSTAVMLLR
jgi:hypothetical protein